MKLSYIRLGAKMQAAPGILSGTLESPGYDLLLISNLRCIKVSHEGWKAAVYIPCEQVVNFSPLE